MAMNRKQLWAVDPKSAAHSVDVEFGRITQAQSCREPHTLFAPLHYEKNYAYPLLIWLHGCGGDERQLRRVMPLISMRNYVAAAPRGTESCELGKQGFDWGESEESLDQAARRVFDCIDAVEEKFNVAPHRIFLGGFESGGTMAFRIGLRHPDRLAGVLSVGGPFPNCGTPLACLRDARNLPLFIAQGRDSQRYPVERTCAELRLFHAAGMAVTLRQYPCGDELYTQMLHDIDVWLMELVTGVSSESEDASTSFDVN
jgi:phospholipase/carboxylesterase